MNTPSSTNTESKRPLRTADLAAAGAAPSAEQQEAERRREAEAAAAQSRCPVLEPRRDPLRPEAAAEPRTPAQEEAQRQRASSAAPRTTPSSERLEPLFADEKAARYRTRWSEVQSGFVDDPRRAVADGDELVAEVMKSLAESFAHEREKLEGELSQTGEASTETLRVGLRRYRAFFDRLLSL
jgi:hypothetical protein